MLASKSESISRLVGRCIYPWFETNLTFYAVEANTGAVKSHIFERMCRLMDQPEKFLPSDRESCSALSASNQLYIKLCNCSPSLSGFGQITKPYSILVKHDRRGATILLDISRRSSDMNLASLSLWSFTFGSSI